jgi:hypothetical protein
MRLIAQAGTLLDLLQVVKDLSFPAENFRIEYTCLASQKQVNSRLAAIELANVIRAYPDLDAPQHRFLLVERDHELCFGEILAESSHSYRQHDHKPYRTSLAAWLARPGELVSPPPGHPDPWNGLDLAEARAWIGVCG